MNVTVLTGALAFSDLVGFTEFTARAGDERAIQLVERQEALARAALPPGARLVKQLGDGLLLYFPDACDALLTCLELADRYAQASTDELPLWVRTGVHFGRPRRRGDDLIGHDVNLASRVADLAGPGEVLTTDATVRALGTHEALRFEELGPVFVKGIPDAVPLFRARRVGAPSSA